MYANSRKHTLQIPYFLKTECGRPQILQSVYSLVENFAGRCCLINLSLPRVRDFRGVNPNAFDGRGNYALGIKEQIIFPEIEYDKVDKVRGMDIIIVTTAKTDEEARELLTVFNMTFAK